jgi:cytochrome P450
MSRESRLAYRRDPLGFLAGEFGRHGDVFRLPGGQVCVAGPAAARDVLGNAAGRYREHSDFFATGNGMFGPRAAQVEIGRHSRALLRRQVERAADTLPDVLDRRLAPTSRWPDAGNWAVYEHLGPALLRPDAPARLRATVDAVVSRAVLAGARERRAAPARAAFRYRAMRELVAAVEDRRAHPATDPADLLDVVVLASPPGTPAAELAEVFLAFVFATVGSLGFVLGWSLYLLGAHREPAEPAWVVREALRLWPVAWLFGRRPAVPHPLGGVDVTPVDEIVVCSYLTHRHPGYWSEPGAFRPERWADGSGQPAFLPFGWGAHTCAGASVVTRLVEDALRIVTGRYEVSVVTGAAAPHVGPALAPPPFELRLRPRTGTHAGRR